MQSEIEPVISHIRSIAATWKKILPYSAWASAVGSLVNAVATKIITDVFDLSGMDVDEAEQTAKLITTVSELDELFIPDPSLETTKNNKNGEVDSEKEAKTIPLTAQFASN